MSVLYASAAACLFYMAWAQKQALLYGFLLSLVFALGMHFPWWGVLLFVWITGLPVAFLLEFGFDALHTRLNEKASV